MNAQKALLDSLLGKDRNVVGDDDKLKQSFKDADVCKYYLVGDCPHEMFVNQEGRAAVNSPIGPCKRQHSEAMKMRFKNDTSYDKYRKRYLGELQAMLQKLVDENDLKARRIKQKLNAGSSCTNETTEAVDGHITAREMLVSEKVEAAEKMAEAGNMEASQDTMREAEKLAHQKYRLSRLKEVAEAWVDDLCEICGSQISWRAVEELEARDRGRPHPHTMGSWHQGWARVREALTKVNEELKEDKSGREEGDVEKNREWKKDREKERSKSRDRDRHRAKENHKDKDRDRDHKNKDVENDRDRDRDKKQSRNGGHKRSRSRNATKSHKMKHKERGQSRKSSSSERRSRSPKSNDHRRHGTSKSTVSHTKEERRREKETFKDTDRNREKEKDRKSKRKRETSQDHSDSHSGGSRSRKASRTQSVSRERKSKRSLSKKRKRSRKRK